MQKPNGLNWKKPTPGYTVTVINMHGDADAFTTTTQSFNHSDEGYATMCRYLTTLDHLADAVGVHREGSTEDVCEWIADKTRRDSKELFSELENVVRSDCTYDDFMARPVGYFVDFIDVDGVTHRAVLSDSIKKDGTVKPMSRVHPIYLQDWEI